VWQKAAREHAYDNWTLDADYSTRGRLFSKIGLATERFRAIDLSCRACGAGAWALGLDSRLGSPLRSVFTPNLRLRFSSKSTKNMNISKDISQKMNLDKHMEN